MNSYQYNSCGLSVSGKFQDMQSPADAVSDVDIPAVVQIDVIRLNKTMPCGRIRDIMADFEGIKRIRDVDHPQTCVEVSDIKECSIDNFPIAGFSELVRPETAAA